MTNTTTTPAGAAIEPLWTDTRIHELVELSYESVVDQVEPEWLMAQMRDDYEAKLAAVRAERDEWMQNVNDLDSLLAQATYAVDDLREQLEALRAEPRWDPVEDGKYPMLLIEGGGRLIRQALSNVTLPDAWSVCRLVPGQDTQPLTEAERDDLLLDADNAMRERAMQRATDAQPAPTQASSDVDRG